MIGFPHKHTSHCITQIELLVLFGSAEGVFLYWTMSAFTTVVVCSMSWWDNFTPRASADTRKNKALMRSSAFADTKWLHQYGNVQLQWKNSLLDFCIPGHFVILAKPCMSLFADNSLMLQINYKERWVIQHKHHTITPLVPLLPTSPTWTLRLEFALMTFFTTSSQSVRSSKLA